VPGIQLLGQGREVQAARTATQDRDAHALIVCWNLYDRQ
jgi:hypothetical protein